MRLSSLILLTAALIMSTSASAQEYQRDNLRITHLHARATVAGQPSGAAYLDIDNTGKSTDTLIAITSPIAKSVEIHTMSMADNVMRMREVTALDIPPSTKIVMTPGDGYHLMLVGLTKKLKSGEQFPMTLRFKKAGKIKVSVVVMGAINERP